MNIPNSLTIARIFFVPILVAVLVQERLSVTIHGNPISNEIVALLIFWVAAATDLLEDVRPGLVVPQGEAVCVGENRQIANRERHGGQAP